MTRKRGNHEGSVFKLPNGRWRGQVSHEGHRLSKVFATQRECMEWVRKNQNQIADGMTFASTQLTLNDYLQDWLTNAKVTKRRATWLHYEELYRIYISPTLGHLKLKDFRSEHIQRLYSELLKMGIGVPTIRKIHAVLHSALQKAVKIGSIPQNPASLVEPPPKPTREMKILTESEVSLMLLVARGDRWEALFHLAVVSGLRGQNY